MLEVLLQPPVAGASLLVMLLTISAAYVIFGIAGFGTALVAGPVLLLYMPLSQVIPLLVVLDLLASSAKLLRGHRHVVRAELVRLLPFMAIGSVLGITVLLKTNADALLLMMGCFVSAYALYMLIRPLRMFDLPPAWAMPLGVLGGLFGALFGSGGFLYAIYLNGRIVAKEQVSATQSTLIGISTVLRLSMLVIAGAYADTSLLVMAVYLLPAMVIGLWAGGHINLKMSREAFIRLINIIILASGVTLVSRALLS